MILARLIRVCASALLCAGVSLFPGNASADGAGTVVDGRAILKMSKGSNLCALTFDDGPSSHTERLMEILRERGIHATFFVVGKQVKYHPELIVRLQQEGHEIGNHTYSHKSLRHLSVDAQRSEILSVQELLRKLGVHSRYIRPPYGNFDANTVAIAKAEGADIMLWSIDSMDWSKRASIENMKTLISGQKLRGVFLFHDTHEQTIEALPEILDRLIADGCQFVTVSEYLAALRQDALPEGVNVAAPAIQENPHQPVPPQGTQAEREAPQQLFQPGDVLPPRYVTGGFCIVKAAMFRCVLSTAMSVMAGRMDMALKAYGMVRAAADRGAGQAIRFSMAEAERPGRIWYDGQDGCRFVGTYGEGAAWRRNQKSRDGLVNFG